MMRGFIIILCCIGIVFSSCVKDFTANPKSPDNWSPSFSVPIGAASIPFDTTVFDGFIPEIPEKSDVSIPIRFEDYPVFTFDQEQIALEGRVEFDFSNLVEDFDQIKRVLLKLKTENGFPTGVEAVIDVKDENESLLFSLIEQDDPLFAIPQELDNDDLVVEPAIARPEIDISTGDIQKLEQAKYLDFQLAVSTQRILEGIITLDTVTFKRDYMIGIEVGLRVDLEIEL